MLLIASLLYWSIKDILKSSYSRSFALHKNTASYVLPPYCIYILYIKMGLMAIKLLIIHWYYLVINFRLI